MALILRDCKGNECQINLLDLNSIMEDLDKQDFDMVFEISGLRFKEERGRL